MKRWLRTSLAVAAAAILTAAGCSDNESQSGITGASSTSAKPSDYLNSLPGKTTKYASDKHAYPGTPGAPKGADSAKSRPKAVEPPAK